MIEIVFQLMLFLSILITSWIVHELGHMLMYYNYTKEWLEFKFDWKELIKFDMSAGITVGTQKQYDKITDYQFKQVALVGILAGASVILSSINMFNNILLWLLLALSYYVSCDNDIKQIININKQQRGKYDGSRH